MRYTNVHGLPDAIVRAVKNDKYDRGKSDLTVSQIIAPPRKVYLEKMHSKEIVEDVSDRVFALLGSGVHAILEQSETKALTEQRMYLERINTIVGGQFDRLLVEEGLLQDYKTTSVFSLKEEVKPEWEQQLNLLSLILMENGYQIDKLEIVAILRDWSKSRVGSKNYPEAPILRIPIELWSIEKTEWYLAERLMLHKQAQQGHLPECSPIERWQSATSWALKKEGRKTAVKLYSDKDEADAALVSASDNHHIEHRKGRNVRCDGYCSVSRFCDQWSAIKPK